MAFSEVPTAHVGRSDLDSLNDYPRPSVAVDVAVLTTVPGGRDSASGAEVPTLAVLLLRRSAAPNAGEWGLPGSMVRDHEQLSAAVVRTLVEKCGIEALKPQQLRVFDDPTRDDRGWVMSVAHQAVVPHHVFGGVVEGRNDLMLASVGSRVGADGVVPVAALPGGQRSLPFDHDRIVGLAVDSLRRRYREAPDPDGLVAQPFTLLDLRLVHEAVEGVPLQKDTFRRHVMPGLEQVEGRSDGTVGRPARLYRRT